MPRYANPDDLTVVAELYHSVWHESHADLVPAEEVNGRSLKFFEDRMRHLLPTTLVEERDGVVAGFSAWNGNLLGQIYVAREFRGLNLADGLLLATEREMKRTGILRAELHCAFGNERARRFYERMGWQHAGEVFEDVKVPDGNRRVTFWLMNKAL